MQVIPVLDLLDGHAVRAVRGERSRYRPIQSSLCATSDPVAIARALVAATGARTLYVADLGAILSRGAHDAALAAICDALGDGLRIWLDAGFTAFLPMRAFVERVLRLTRSAAPAAILPVFGTETLVDAGPDLDTFASVRALAGARELIGAGGIRNDDDLARADDSGAHAWLVASAIHDGTVGRRDVHRGAFGL